MHKPYKTYKELKQKQKLRIANFMYRETLRFYLTHGHMPTLMKQNRCVPLFTPRCSVLVTGCRWMTYGRYF